MLIGICLTRVWPSALMEHIQEWLYRWKKQQFKSFCLYRVLFKRRACYSNWKTKPKKKYLIENDLKETKSILSFFTDRLSVITLLRKKILELSSQLCIKYKLELSKKKWEFYSQPISFRIFLMLINTIKVEHVFVQIKTSNVSLIDTNHFPTEIPAFCKA